MDVPTDDGAFSTPSTSSLSFSSDEEFVPQSGFEMIDNTNMTTEVTTTFSDFNPGMTYDVGDVTDETYGVSDDANMSLNAFLARPIKLASYDWAIGADLNIVFSPWLQFLTQPRVANRISNYRNFRGRLHLKFMVNGNPFYFGLALASYLPLPTNDEFAPGLTTSPEDLVLASQLPHVYIDPTNNVGGTIICPFFWQYNSIDLTTNDMANLGNINIRRVVALEHANGGTSSLNITVLAWMTDVHLSGPTATNIFSLIPQSGDEYGDNSNSDTPHVLTRAKNLAITISRYARASQMISMGAESAMKLLGFCKPIELSVTMPMRNTALGNLCNVNLGDATQKLALDCKQEVVIDPRTVGLKPDDEMNIVELAKRESLINIFQWQAAAPVDTALQYHAVTPMQYQSSGVGTATAYSMAPSAWTAIPFTYWRGSMMFRIKIVASSFHKGRLRITYDPNNAVAVDQYNVTQNHIVDIAQCRDFCLKIGWNSPRSYLEVGTFGAEPFGPLPITSSTAFINGTLKFEVLNELSAPATGAQIISVVVFTSMCDDFEVQGPDGGKLSTLMYFPEPVGLLANADIEPQSGVEGVAENLDNFNAPCMESNVCTLAPTLDDDNTPNIYFGEKIKSWRTCTKRFNYHSCSSVIGGTGVNNFTRPVVPNYRGFCPTAVNKRVGDLPYNYSDMTLLNWLIPAYGGMRGSLRHKWAFAGQTSNAVGSFGSIELVRAAGRPGWSENQYLFATAPNGGVNTTNEAGYYFRRYWSHTWPGAMQSSMSQCPSVEVEIPYQDNRRFWHARRTNYDVANTELPGYRLDIMSAAASNGFVQHFWASGDDFSLFFFLNTPRTYVFDVDPAPFNS